MAEPAMELLCADAQRSFEEGGKVQSLSFWTFKVMLRARHPAFQATPVVQFPGAPTAGQKNFVAGDGFVDFCAWHRYSDFEWLLEYLAEACPGTPLPPVPAKELDATVDKVTDLVGAAHSAPEAAAANQLVALRIRRFNLFLAALVALPEVFEAEAFRAFCTLEEPAWLTYKEHAARQRFGTGVQKLRGKLFGAVAAVSAAVDKKGQFAFDAATPVGAAVHAQLALGRQLHACAAQMDQLRGIARRAPPALKDLDAAYRRNGGPLPDTLVFPGHFAADRAHTGGVVRHVDARFGAFVHWDGAAAAERVADVGGLRYPESGVVDPASFAVTEFLTQIDSFLAAVGRRSEVGRLERLADVLWFWGAYATALRDAARRVEAIENRRLGLAEEAAKTKDAAKRQHKEREAAALGDSFRRATRRLEEAYATVYRPMQRSALAEALGLAGDVGAAVLEDAEWPARVRRAESVLGGADAPGGGADVPVEVQRMLEELAAAPPPAAAADGRAYDEPNAV